MERLIHKSDGTLRPDNPYYPGRKVIYGPNARVTGTIVENPKKRMLAGTWPSSWINVLWDQSSAVLRLFGTVGPTACGKNDIILVD